MRFGRKPAIRRLPRDVAFRSRDLIREMREPVAPFLKERGFRRLGERGWVAGHEGHNLLIAIQCSQSGWEGRSGNQFVVEFELSSSAAFSTGFHRDRLWRLLDDQQRAAASELNRAVARTLPEPDAAFVAGLSADAAAYYLRGFEPQPVDLMKSDVWFKYYDEADAANWGLFLGEVLEPAVDRFLSAPRSFFGHRKA